MRKMLVAIELEVAAISEKEQVECGLSHGDVVTEEGLDPQEIAKCVAESLPDNDEMFTKSGVWAQIRSAKPVFARDAVKPHPRLDALQEALEALTDYLLEECPDDENWEDFDPQVEALRTELQELIEKEEIGE